MAKRLTERADFEGWARGTGRDVEEVRAAWHGLRRRGLASMKRAKPAVSQLAMRRASTDPERRLASHLSGYLLTESSFIVRRSGDPAGSPGILDTRIAVEHIANYFKEGWGVTDIQRDLGILTREEIEAALQYYLNHREEIERDMERSRAIYDAHAPAPETIPA